MSSGQRWRPQVSVIVPVYNGERTIEACLTSLLAQDYPRDRFRIIAVDNGSTDRTAAILASFADRIRVLHESKRGAAAARNRGLNAADGEVIALTDADCVVDPAWLANIVEPLVDPKVAVAGGRILSVRPCNAIEAYGEEIHDHEKAIGVWKPPYAITMNWAMRRALLADVGCFAEDFLRGQDVDLAYRIVQSGYRLAYARDAIVRHHNERTYGGLFREGFVHGLHSVHVMRKHAAFLAAHGHRRFSARSWVAVAAAFRDSLVGRERERARCVAVFNAGKKLGKLAGSLRFRHFEA
jgi:glycosyltransferase involved in cell wall biosynthesis